MGALRSLRKGGVAPLLTHQEGEAAPSQSCGQPCAGVEPDLGTWQHGERGLGLGGAKGGGVAVRVDSFWRLVLIERSTENQGCLEGDMWSAERFQKVACGGALGGWRGQRPRWGHPGARPRAVAEARGAGEAWAAGSVGKQSARAVRVLVSSLCASPDWAERRLSVPEHLKGPATPKQVSRLGCPLQGTSAPLSIPAAVSPQSCSPCGVWGLRPVGATARYETVSPSCLFGGLWEFGC